MHEQQLSWSCFAYVIDLKHARFILLGNTNNGFLLAVLYIVSWQCSMLFCSACDTLQQMNVHVCKSLNVSHAV